MVVLAALLLYATTLRPDAEVIDFKLDPPPVVAAGPAHTADGARSGNENAGDDTPAAPARPHFRLATGFGHEVPLSFAVRQVVPAHIKVAFDNGVDRDVPVSWQGGRPWNEVLRAAVKPLGLHITLSPGIVRISN